MTRDKSPSGGSKEEVQSVLKSLCDSVSCFFGFFCPAVSPYLKSLSMVAANKLLHLLEAFSTPWFLFSSPQNHHLVFFLLEVFNNIIQYQFDGENTDVNSGRIEQHATSLYQRLNLPHRELQPRVRHHPEEERFPPAGQPAVRHGVYSEGPAEEEEVWDLQNELYRDGVHGGLQTGCAC